MESFLRLVGAEGEDVPFLEYVNVEVEFSLEEAGLCSCLQALVLIVPDKAYNQRVLLVIGTDRCEEQGGVGFLQRTNTPHLHGKERINQCRFKSIF